MRPNFSNIHRSPNELCILSMIIILYFSDLHGFNLGGSQPLSGQTAPQALKRTHYKILFKINQHIKNYITDTHLVIWASLWAECLNWLPSIKSNRNIPGPSNLHDGADQALQAKFDFHRLMWKVKWETESRSYPNGLARPLLRNLGFKANLTLKVDPKIQICGNLRDKKIGELPPHVFAIGDNCYTLMRRTLWV